MNWKSFIIGVGIGLIASYTASEIIATRSVKSSDAILHNMKNLFNKLGNVTGSWILIKAESYEETESSYTVYKGGISLAINGETQHYQFVADAFTGELLDSYLFRP